MRNANTITRKRNRSRRRALLGLLVMASSTSVLTITSSTRAESGSSIGVMPPLPLHPVRQVNNVVIQANPFFILDTAEAQASERTKDALVQLASGGATPAVRLKPIGAAIGLHPIGSPRIVSNTGSAMTIDQLPESAIKTNPLVGSSHHENGQLVESAVESKVVNVPQARSAPEPLIDRTRGSSTNVNAFEAQRKVNHQKANPRADIELPKPRSLDTKATSHTEAVQSSQSEAIFFSLSDLDSQAMISEPTNSDSVQAVPQSEQLFVADLAVEDTVLAEATGLVPAIDVVESTSIAPEPMPFMDDAAMLAMETSPRELQKTTSSASPSKLRDQNITIAEAPAFADPSVQETETRATRKRYRPPVAVEAVPQAYDWASAVTSNSTAQPVVESAQAPRLTGQSDSNVFEDPSDTLMASLFGDQLTPLYLNRTQVRSLTLGGSLHKVSIEDQNVCRAIASGANQIKLIGAGRGVTRLVVWASTDESELPIARQFVVHVQDAVATTGVATEDKIQVLAHTISQTFPRSNVHLTTVGEQLVVRGVCSSEDEATQIVRMIRKTCLVPVRDELSVR